jgi:hypothetical protein
MYARSHQVVLLPPERHFAATIAFAVAGFLNRNQAN